MTQPDLSTIDQLVDLQGADVRSSDGQTIGTVEQIWVDNVNALPEWAAVKVKGGTRHVPLRAADLSGDGVVVNYTRDEVLASPPFEPGSAGRDDIEGLYRHYRQPLPAPPPPKVRNPFDQLTATWVPGVREKAASYAERFPKGGGSTPA